MRIALVGVGSMGRFHHQACVESDLVDIVAACDVDTNAVAALDPSLTAFTNFGELLASGIADAVIINTPHHLHDDMAVRALEAGLHVLVEKPMAISVERCDRMLAAMERSGTKLSVGHIQQHLPDKLAAKAYLDSGELGTVVGFMDHRSANYDTGHRPSWFFEPERAGGGILMNIGAHCVDRIVWLGDSPVESVTAWTAKRLGRLVDSEAALQFRLVNGIRAAVTLSSSTTSNIDKLTILGSEGTLVAGAEFGVRVIRRNESVLVQAPVPTPMLDAIRGQVREFATAVGHGGLGNPWHARHVIEVIRAAYTSSDEDRTVRLAGSPRRAGAAT